jgi:hypothetical protein
MGRPSQYDEVDCGAAQENIKSTNRSPNGPERVDIGVIQSMEAAITSRRLLGQYISVELGLGYVITLPYYQVVEISASMYDAPNGPERVDIYLMMSIGAGRLFVGGFSRSISV